MSATNDDALRSALDNLDAAGFEALVLAYQDRLYAFARGFARCNADAEEIVQDALVRAYRALVSYPAERRRSLQLRPWLFQIVVNVARNKARGRRISAIPIDLAAAQGYQEPQTDHDDQPDALVERDERRDDLRAHVASLPERYRVAVVLRHVNGFGYEEIARLLDQPVGTVKANVHRGVRLLRAALGAEQVIAVS